MAKKPGICRAALVAGGASLLLSMTIGAGCSEVAERRRRKRPPPPVPTLPEDADPALFAFVEAPYEGERLQTRPVMIYADTPQNPDALEQLAMLGSAPAPLDDREVIVVEVYGSGVSRYRGQPLSPESAKSWHDRYRAGRWGFEVVLVDKDGGVILRRPRVTPVEDLVAVIDATPLRRQEVYQRSRGVGGAGGATQEP